MTIRNISIHLTIIHILAVFPLLPSSISAAETGHSLTVIDELMETRQWPTAESALLEYLWNSPSGIEGASACEAFARVCVMVHKAPIAMEWLEIAINNPDIDEAWKIKLQNRLKILHRIYLPGQEFRPDRSFQINGVEMESPRDLIMLENGQMVVMDRYRLITLAPDGSGRFNAIPPTTPLPDHTRTLKIVKDRPVIITDYGFWDNHKMYGFQGSGEIERIIDAIYTIHDEWFILDRRNAHMLKFDPQGQFQGPVVATTPNGDEKLLPHPFGGCWILAPASRQISTAGMTPEIKIPFNGPGYNLADPVAIATDWFGHLYVLNSNSTVSIFSPGGSCLHTLKLDPEKDILKSPAAILVAEDGRLYIADRKKHDVFCYR